MLGDLGVRVTADTWQTLVTDDPGTLPALLQLARRADPDSPAGQVAAHIAWWTDQGDSPGSGAVVQVLTDCRTRWITVTAPQAEQQPGTWRAWLRVTDDGLRPAVSQPPPRRPRHC